jgi:hypothetical protein
MQMHLPSRSAAVVLSLIVGASAGAEEPASPPPGVKLQVVSVRTMSPEESAKRSPADVIGLDAVVRLRLSTSERGIWFLAATDPVIVRPRGYTVRVTPAGVVWRFSSVSGQEGKVSPGIERIASAVPCGWVVLPPFTAVEWDELDSTSQAPEKRAQTVFIKEAKAGVAIEIRSDAFDAPLRATLWPYGK